MPHFRSAHAALVLTALLTADAAGDEDAPKPAWLPDAPSPDPDLLPPGAFARLGSTHFKHGNAIETVTFSPDGHSVVSASPDCLVFWDAATGRELHRHRSIVKGLVVVAAGGNTLAVVNGSPEMRLFDLTTGTSTAVRLSADASFSKVAVSPDGAVVAAVHTPSKSEAGGHGTTWTRRIGIWDVARSRKLRELNIGDGLPTRVALSPGGNRLAELREDCGLHVWDVKSGRERRAFGAGPGDAPFNRDLAFSPNGLAVIYKGRHGGIRVVDPETNKELCRLDELPGDRAPAFSPDGKLVAVAAVGGVRLYEAAGGREVRRLAEPGNETFAAAFSADGKSLVTGGSDGQVRIWDVASGRCQIPPVGHASQVLALAFSPDGRGLASRDGAGVIRKWDMRTAGLTDGSLRNPSAGLRDPSRKLVLNAFDFLTLRFTRDGRSLVCADDGNFVWREPGTLAVERRSGAGARDRQVAGATAALDDGRTWLAGPAESGGVVVWDDAGGEVAHLPGLPAEPLLGVALAPDGRHAAISVGDQCVLWDLARRAEVQRWRVRIEYGTFASAFSADGRLLAAPDDGGGTRVIEVASGGEAACLARVSAVAAPAFAPGGRVLATAEYDGPILLWDLTGTRDKPARGAPSAAELSALWDDLLGDGAARACRAVWRLADCPAQAVPFLRERLEPAKRVRAETVPEMVAALDDWRFATRQAAFRALCDAAECAEPEIRRAARASASAEAGAALGRVLKALDGERSHPTGERLRAVRAVQALEYMRTPESRALLERLAGGAPGATLTREARAALDRAGR